jgi:hypothetical protein
VLSSKGVGTSKRVLVVDDGANSWKLIATAVHLAELGSQVEIMTPQGSVGTGLGPMSLGPALKRVFTLGIVSHLYQGLIAVSDAYAEAYHAVTGEVSRFGPYDAVVTAFHNRANDGLYHRLKGRVHELHRIGDCLAPRGVLDAIREGEFVARAL